MPQLSNGDLHICEIAMHHLIDINRPDYQPSNVHRRNRKSDAYYLAKLFNFLETFATEKYSDVFPKPTPLSGGICHVFDAEIGKKFDIKLLPDWVLLVRNLPVECSFSLEIEIFRSACNDHLLPSDDCDFNEFCTLRFPLARTVGYWELYENIRTRVNNFLADLHTRLRDPRTRKKILDRRSAVKKNCQEFTHYVDKLFARYARLLVIRIDLGYRKNAYNSSIEDLAEDLAHLWANMRHNKIFSDLIGNITKMEYGVEKGAHAHLLLFFDGSKRSRDCYIAKEIGKYWERAITKGRGHYWNCNDPEHKRNYTKIGALGIGMINADHFKLRNNLNFIVRYFCKSEQFCKPLTRLKMKLLRKGQCPRPTGLKRGAPRASQQNARSHQAFP